MTWSLQLRNGDLALGQASFGVVTAEAKLAQDLRCFILERMGSDDLHPEYGSLLDGGLRRGQYVEGVIGSTNDALALVMIEGEIRRIVTDYQAQQLDRARADRARYGKATLTKGEVLVGLAGIDVEQVADTMNITLHLSTAANTSVSLDIAFSGIN